MRLKFGFRDKHEDIKTRKGDKHDEQDATDNHSTVDEKKINNDGDQTNGKQTNGAKLNREQTDGNNSFFTMSVELL